MKISNHLFHTVVQPMHDLLCWQWFLILCELPLFTFPPSFLKSNLYVLNSKSRDCGSIRPIQPETMDAASSMVWWVVKYRVGWLSAHCSYHYTRFNGRWSHLSRGSFISVWNSKQLFILRPMYQNKPHCLAYRVVWGIIDLMKYSLFSELSGYMKCM